MRSRFPQFCPYDPPHLSSAFKHCLVLRCLLPGRPLQFPPPPVLCSPQGKTCAGGSDAPEVCTADQGQPYLGQSSGCTSCDHGTTKVTSEAGDAYCTVPFFDRKCNESPYTAGGYEWDESTASCVQCRAGTYRSTTMLEDATFVADCQEW